MPAEITTLGKLAISPIVDPYTLPGTPDLLLNFGSFEKGITEVVADANLMRAEIARRLNRVRTAKYVSQPRLEMQPTAVEMARLMNWTLGSAPTGTTYRLGNGCRVARMMYDDNTEVWDFPEVAVSSFSMRSSDNDPTVSVSLGLLAKNCVPGATFPPALATAVVDGTTWPFIHQDSTSTAPTTVSTVLVAGQPIRVQAVDVEINNALLTDRFLNSKTLTDFVKVDRSISVRFTYPFGDYPNIYELAATETVGVPIEIKYESNNCMLKLNFPAVLFPRQPVTIPLRNEVIHQLVGTAYRTPADEELVVTLDSTP